MNFIPKYCVLINSMHYPPLDNQGRVSSCAAQASTYIQFTNAVSRKINRSDWTPAYNIENCFSPKFTHLFGQTELDDIYALLKDQGCLTQDNCFFEKDEGGGSIEFDDGELLKNSVSWNVAEGNLRKALKFHLCNVNKINGNDVRSITELVDEIKKQIFRGNVVVVSVVLGNWITVEIDNESNCGTYGHLGDRVVVASRRFIPAGHCFCIVGYDDEITVNFAGEKISGAFLVSCSYGHEWMNGGYCWMLYDAIGEMSTHDKLNNPSIYNGDTCLTYLNQFCLFSPVHISENNVKSQIFKFIRSGDCSVYGQKYCTYIIKHLGTNKYLSICDEINSEFPVLKLEKTLSEKDYWCIVPYETLKEWGISEANYDRSYEKSYWIFSKYLYNRQPNGRCFLDGGLNYYEIGRKVGISKYNDGKYPQAKSWHLEGYNKQQEFCSYITSISPDGIRKTKRTYSLKDFWFVDWEKDIDIGYPCLMAEVVVETKDRESFSIVLTRTDRNGTTNVHYPEIFKNNHIRYVGPPNMISFDGIVNTSVAETGYFTMQYGDLLCMPEDKNIEDYTWGVVIRTKEHSCVNVKELRLLDGNFNVLSVITPQEESIENEATFSFKVLKG